MGGQFDKKLVDKIRDTFDGYDDAGADEAWIKLLQKKYKNKKTPVLWWFTAGSIAAAILLFFLLFRPQTPIESNIAKIKTVKSLKQNNNITEPIKEQPLNTRKEELSALNRQKSPGTNSNVDRKTLKNNTENAVFQQFANLNQGNQKNFNSNIIAFKPAPEAIVGLAVNESNAEKEVSKARFEDLLKADQKNILAKADAKNQKKQGKNSRFKVDVGASTFMNFSEGASNSTINLGLGLLSEYAISSKVSLLSGVTFARQSANFISGSRVVSLANSSAAQQDQIKFSSSAFMVSSPEQVKASFVNLDIPLNVKIRLPGTKTNWFLSTGVSSFLLLNEQYKYEYNVSTLNFDGARTTSTTTETQENPSGRSTSFAFARALNLSLGITYPAGKKANLTFEPFIKYPVGGLGTQEIKIGSGGLNLKLNFSGRK